MKIGLNLLLYTAVFSKNEVDLIKKVADMGYDGVEIPFIDLSVMDAAATAKAREAAGVGLTSCAVALPGTSITSTDAEERKVGIERLKQVVDISAEMGSEVICGPLYAPVRQLTGVARTDDEWKWGVEGIHAAAVHAEPSGVKFAVEPLNRFETHFLNVASDVLAFVKAVNHPLVGAQLDTFHGNIEEKDTPAAIRSVGSHLYHFHASESDRGDLGTGQVDWDGSFAALKDINYDGWVTIESFATGLVDLCGAACVWRPIYDSADGLAKDGLAFLKQNLQSA